MRFGTSRRRYAPASSMVLGDRRRRGRADFRRFDLALAAGLLILGAIVLSRPAHSQPPADEVPASDTAPAPAPTPITPPVLTVATTPVRTSVATVGGTGLANELHTPGPPADLRDLDAWVTYRMRAQLPMLPQEARLFYRRGLIAWKSGQDAEAVRLMRGASLLDPTFVAPHQALASWYLTREPSQALQEYAAVLQLMRRDFLLQLDLAANALFYFMHMMFFALLGTGLLVVLVHQAELRHVWQERLGRIVSPTSARVWPWVMLVLPFFAGLGVAIPTLVFLGLLWPLLKLRERVLMVALAMVVVAAPLSAVVMGRLALPMRTDSAPFYGVGALENAPWSAPRQAELAALAERAPDDAFAQFGLAWIARRGEDMTVAESAYRRALVGWPKNDRVLVNLANILAIEGRFDEALARYHEAIAADPGNAAAWFNSSQVYTRLFDFRNATEAVSRASALDFEMVQRFQSQSVGGALPLADQWIEPRTFWGALLTPTAARIARPTLPPSWRGLIEASNMWFGLMTLLLAGAAIAIGVHWNRNLPLRPCSNCGHVVCRRCAERRREVALCPACATVEARAESADFGKVLLAQQRKNSERRDRGVRTALAALVPGYGLTVFRDVFGAVLMLMIGTFVASVLAGINPPFDAEHDYGLAGPGAPAIVLLTACALVYAVSILAYVTRQARLDSQLPTGPVRSRAAQVTHHQADAA